MYSYIYNGSCLNFWFLEEIRRAARARARAFLRNHTEFQMAQEFQIGQVDFQKPHGFSETTGISETTRIFTNLELQMAQVVGGEPWHRWSPTAFKSRASGSTTGPSCTTSLASSSCGRALAGVSSRPTIGRRTTHGSISAGIF